MTAYFLLTLIAIGKSWKIDQSRSVDLFPQLLQGYAIDEMCANRRQYIRIEGAVGLVSSIGVGSPLHQIFAVFVHLE